MNAHTKYLAHKNSAKQRGIRFLLTFEEWFVIWEDSGVFHLRGRQRGQYCMARYGDKGPYAVGNVEIIPMTKNSSDSMRGKHHTQEHKIKMGEISFVHRTQAKLTVGAVREIQRLHKPWSRTTGTTALATKFEVCEDTIRNVINGKCWGRVTGKNKSNHKNVSS